MVADSAHYRADSPAAMASALLELMSHARTSGDDYTWGPIDLAQALRNGLDVYGPGIYTVTSKLDVLPGLVRVS